MSEGAPSRFAHPSHISQQSTTTTTSSNPIVEHDYVAVSEPESFSPSVCREREREESRMLSSLSDTLPPPKRARSPLQSDEDWIGNEDVYGSDDNFGDLNEETEYDLLPRGVPLHVADPVRHGLMTDHPTLELPGMGPPPVSVGLNDVRGRPMYAPPMPPPVPREIPSGLPTPSSESGSSLRLIFPARADYHDLHHRAEEDVEPGPSHMTDRASETSELSHDADAEGEGEGEGEADNERSEIISVTSLTPSMFSDTSAMSDVSALPSPSQTALHIVLVGHKAPDQLKEEILEAVFALYPGHVVPRDTSTDAGETHSSTLQFYDYRAPVFGNENAVEEMRVYDLTLRHAVTSYYSITGKMVTPPVPVLTVFFIDPALCKGRVPGFFPSAMIGKSIAVVLPRSDATSTPQHLSPIGSEHSDLPREADYISIGRGVEPADLMSAQHIWSNLKASSLFEGIEIRHTVDFDRQVISIDELWAASARYEARSAALRLINPNMLPSVVRTESSQEPASPLAESVVRDPLSASTSTIGGSVHTARGSMHLTPLDPDSRTLVSQEPAHDAEDDLKGKRVNGAMSLLEDAAALLGSMHLSKYAQFLPALRNATDDLQSFVSQNLRTVGAIAIMALAMSALYLRGGSTTPGQMTDRPLAPLTPAPTIRPAETSADAAVFTQKVQGMDIPRATPLLTLDTVVKPLGLSAAPQPLSISGATDMKTLDTSLIPLPLNTDLITVDRTGCDTCFQLVGSPRSKSDAIVLGGTTATPGVRVAYETGAGPSSSTIACKAGSAVETEASSMGLMVKDLERTVGTFITNRHKRAVKNVRALNAMGGKAAKAAMDTIVASLNPDNTHDSTSPDDEPSWYDEFMEPLRQALAERRERKELMIAEEDSVPSKRRPAGKIVQEFLFRGAHALVV